MGGGSWRQGTGVCRALPPASATHLPVLQLTRRRLKPLQDPLDHKSEVRIVRDGLGVVPRAAQVDAGADAGGFLQCRQHYHGYVLGALVGLDPRHALVFVGLAAQVVLTFRSRYGETEGQTPWVDAAVLRSYARYFNPNIKVEPILLPPRQEKQGVCCTWEFTLR